VAIPTVNSVGAQVQTNTTVAVAPGAGHTSGDIDIIIVESANDPVTLSVAAGFAELTAISPVSIAGQTRLTIFWRRWNGTDGSPTIDVTGGDHAIARMISISGCIASGNPWDITGTGTNDTTADTTVSIAGGTTTVADCLIMLMVAQALPDSNTTTEFSGETNADLSSLTERMDHTRNIGNGGAIGMWTGGKAAAGAFGATTVTAVTSSQRVCAMIALKPAATQKSFGGSITPTGVATRKAKLPKAGSTTPTGTLTRQAKKPLAGAITPIGTLTRRAKLPKAGSITPTGTLTRKAKKPLAGAITPIGTLTRSIRTLLAGSTTPTGTLTNRIRMSFAGAVTPTGDLTLLRKVVLALGGAITPIGTLTSQIRKSLAGAATLTGTLTKRTAKPLAGEITPTGDLSLFRKIVLALSGAITPTGVLTRRTRKQLAGATTPIGLLARSITKRLTGTVTPSGTLQKKIRMSLAGAITPIGSLLVGLAAEMRNLIWRASRLVGRYRTSGLRERDRWRIGGPFE
jgi:hypothetical protein